MKGAKVRLVVASILFVGWLGYLAFLAFNYSRPVVVSRSQMMIATHLAEAKIFLENDRPVRAEIIRFLGKTPEADVKPGTEPILIADLQSALQINQKPLQNEGIYLLPLVEQGKSKYALVSPPRSPGLESPPARPLIYPFSPEVEKQVRDLLR